MIPPDDLPRPEYPRPQFVRPDWQNLNGIWEFSFDDADRGLGEGWAQATKLSGEILVPFPYQSSLSGIGDTSIHETVWYARDFEVPRAWRSGDVILHFGAVDYSAIVWVNGCEVGHNRGGHVPFSFNIAPYLREGKNRLALRVVDRQDPGQPRGKQSVTGVPRGIDYYCSTGIWQTVWLEPVPKMRIAGLVAVPHVEHEAFELTVRLHAPGIGWRVEAELLDGGKAIATSAQDTHLAGARFWIPIRNARLWSPESPHLYDLRVRLIEHASVVDEVTSYTGMRNVLLRDGKVLVNGQPTYLAMVLDQGYWPDGLIAAPSDDALRADVEMTRRLGFNGARKHQKIEDPRWLYWCDRLGLLAWSEMPNARAWSPEAEEWLLAEWERAVRRDVNHPCIVAWVPMNESMGVPQLQEHHPGQYAFLERIVRLTRRLDHTRPVIDNDGWEHTNVTDICAVHDYTPTAEGLARRYRETMKGGPLPETVWYKNKPLFVLGAKHRGQPVILTEVGGFLAARTDIPPEQRDPLYKFYEAFQDSEDLFRKYRDLMEGLAALKFLAGFCYTQLTDVEQEVNGLLTYDRRPKIDPERIAALHRELFPPNVRLA